MPNFLIIGAQKSGTTSLYYYLTHHPQILTVLQKEIHFFDFNYHQGIDWYNAHFATQCPHRLSGEASPYYLFHPWVPQRVRQHFPAIKLIVLLRDPVDRAISHYYHEVTLGFETLPLKKAIAAEPERLHGELEKLKADPTYYSYNHQHYSYLSRGRYLEQLQPWMARFPREQFLILTTEEFRRDPAKILAQVLAFLDLPIVDLATYPHYNAGNYTTIDPSFKQQLREYFCQPNQQLSDYLQREMGWIRGKR